ncbi:MAG: VCBS repeat-containing protein [Armatimonadetes bacterium]|nr:VCBS repeat-containing protein [Armatimonadota bacterium]
MILAVAIAVAGSVTWQKVTVDTHFRSEAVAVADVNRDGSPDVLVGDLWYDGKTKESHEIRQPLNLGDGLETYSEAFAVWAYDVNRDGWPDQIVIGYPGTAVKWYENPRGKTGHWKEHTAWPSACNESPLFVDLFRDRRPVLVMGVQPAGKDNEGHMAWLEPAKDPAALWTCHEFSAVSAPGTQRFSHGLGVGDINGDGRNDIVTMDGWWEQPREGRKSTKPWQFHSAKLGGPAAQLAVLDINGDGMADVIASSAHNYGIWAAIQQPDGSFQIRDLFPKLVSSTHSLALADLDKDGVPDLVTGKRFWAHGWNDPGAREPARLYWLHGKRSKDKTISFEPVVVDEDSGVGTGFVVTDFDGDGGPDIVVSNKKGVHVFLQRRS